ncbi:MAG: acetyl-CoA carboxylase biotin carboxyl carrier protein [Chitinophagales bacterium]|nr:acetyl-CoA carboxylase biotin carboxyl carrier protein [Bacteroidota bacterium]MBP7400768.1 acetyl-CoA carboxylase biotin carboxyl carrier protein [Chitinophagales bacterium]MBK8488976.1 acetyl-CoA carboxylase biotin carboxyl carrier protein [Bacteroidota bacterium]MBK8680824.1 acetyl-CoA carboxylase biotin carboxyl carrier protein [Bacteroidota bacterium]MBP8755181.1 acetyl-CoA carboxylase biotin carboxyl carrier protein [Chitinophagales bacterium]
MDFKQIQELIRLVGKNNISELSIEEENFKIKIKTVGNSPVLMESPTYMQAPPVQAPVQIASPVVESSKDTTTKLSSAEQTESVNEKLIIIKSPIVGTFYRSSGPDKEVFINVGDNVNVGSVLCIIEAMKLFNEIESEYSGTIVKILVDDATPVEYDQPLFLIDTK